jgi:hypothetical protein
LFEPALFGGDGEGGPAGPVGVGDFERSGGGAGGEEGGEDQTEGEGAEKAHEEAGGVNHGECYFLIKSCYARFPAGCMPRVGDG